MTLKCISAKKPQVITINNVSIILVKDIDREKAPSNKSSTLSKCMKMNIWVIGTSTQLFVRRS